MHINSKIYRETETELSYRNKEYVWPHYPPFSAWVRLRSTNLSMCLDINPSISWAWIQSTQSLPLLLSPWLILRGFTHVRWVWASSSTYLGESQIGCHFLWGLNLGSFPATMSLFSFGFVEMGLWWNGSSWLLCHPEQGIGWAHRSYCESVLLCGCADEFLSQQSRNY